MSGGRGWGCQCVGFFIRVLNNFMHAHVDIHYHSTRTNFVDGEVGGDGGDDGGVLSESPLVVFGSKAGPGSGLSEGGLKKY